MVPATLLTALFFALTVAANPIILQRSPVKLSISRRVNVTSVRDIIRHDQARAKSLRAHGNARAACTALHNDAVVNSQADNQAVSYVASVGVGSPATYYDLIIDTGSSNTWIGSGKSYVKTSTSTKTANSVKVVYGSGSFSGTEYVDRVTIASGLVIPKQSIGVGSTSSGFSGVDGILGIGPVDLTVNTLYPAVNSRVPTVTDNLSSSRTIASNKIGISFRPMTSATGEQWNGELTWGGVDSSKYIGAISYAPITYTEPASQFWGIDQSIHYGTTTILSSNAGIVDTGTTLILIATDAFQKYQDATGGIPDSNSGLLSITTSQYQNLKPLYFDINDVSFELTPNAQIWPRNLNSLLGGPAEAIFLVVADIGNDSGSGLDFINGQTFLERFYSVFDTTNKRVGLANTHFTTATSN